MHTSTQYDIRLFLSLGVGVLLLLAVLTRVLTQHLLYAYHRYVNATYVIYGLTAVHWTLAAGVALWGTAPVTRALGITALMVHRPGLEYVGVVLLFFTTLLLFSLIAYTVCRITFGKKT